MPSIFSINTDASQYELMAQTCHLWNVWKISITFHRCTTDSLQVGNSVWCELSSLYGLLTCVLCSAFSTAMRLSVDSVNSSSVNGSLSLFSGWWIEFRM